MLRRVLRLLIPTVLVALVAVPANAQSSYRIFKEWYGWVHTGYLMPQGDYGDATKEGWLFGGGATYRPGNSQIGIDIGLDYHDNNIKRSVLEKFDADRGDASVWSFSVGPRWEPRTRGSVGFFLRGGLSVNYVHAYIGNATWVPGYVCDPWAWWWCYPGWVPGTVVTADISTTKIGYYGGIGITFKLSQTSAVYLEATYRTIRTQTSTDYIPIVIGYRW